MVLFVQKVLPYVFIAFIALIALPLPIIMLASPLHQLYKNMKRKRYYKTLDTFCDRPFAMTEEQLSEIFPEIKPNANASEFYFEEPEADGQ